MRCLSVTSLPVRRSTNAPLIPEPPMSTPNTISPVDHVSVTAPAAVRVVRRVWGSSVMLVMGLVFARLAAVPVVVRRVCGSSIMRTGLVFERLLAARWRSGCLPAAGGGREARAGV
jgi:hypothetical protein